MVPFMPLTGPCDWSDVNCLGWVAPPKKWANPLVPQKSLCQCPPSICLVNLDGCCRDCYHYLEVLGLWWEIILLEYICGTKLVNRSHKDASNYSSFKGKWILLSLNSALIGFAVLESRVVYLWWVWSEAKEKIWNVGYRHHLSWQPEIWWERDWWVVCRGDV